MLVLSFDFSLFLAFYSRFNHTVTVIVFLLQFYLNKVVWEEAPLPVQVSLHPAVFLDVPHVLDDVTRPQRQLVIVERLVFVLHQDLCSEEESGEEEEDNDQQKWARS